MKSLHSTAVRTVKSLDSGWKLMCSLALPVLQQRLSELGWRLESPLSLVSLKWLLAVEDFIPTLSSGIGFRYWTSFEALWR